MLPPRIERANLNRDALAEGMWLSKYPIESLCVRSDTSNSRRPISGVCQFGPTLRRGHNIDRAFSFRPDCLGGGT